MPKPLTKVQAMVQWGIRIRRARLALGLQQKDLADIGGVQPGTVSAWEKGRSPPDQYFLMRFADVYSIDPAYILNGKMDKLDAEIRKKIQGNRV